MEIIVSSNISWKFSIVVGLDRKAMEDTRGKLRPRNEKPEGGRWNSLCRGSEPGRWALQRGHETRQLPENSRERLIQPGIVRHRVCFHRETNFRPRRNVICEETRPRFSALLLPANPSFSSPSLVFEIHAPLFSPPSIVKIKKRMEYYNTFPPRSLNLFKLLFPRGATR